MLISAFTNEISITVNINFDYRRFWDTSSLKFAWFLQTFIKASSKIISFCRCGLQACTACSSCGLTKLLHKLTVTSSVKFAQCLSFSNLIFCLLYHNFCALLSPLKILLNYNTKVYFHLHCLHQYPIYDIWYHFISMTKVQSLYLSTLNSISHSLDHLLNNT